MIPDVYAPRRCLFASFLAAFALRQRLVMLNKRNAAFLANQSVEEKEDEEPTRSEEVADTDPRYVFMT